uniref:Putative secreted protein n=1 Tax=Anopheles triannulatus TaxID=58253 RepID=A0A2M4B0L3_9DIPT
MPPDPVPVVRFRATVVVVVVLRCFRLLAPPAAARGAEVGFDGDRLPLPTDVALAGVGIMHRYLRGMRNGKQRWRHRTDGTIYVCWRKVYL